jgi:hypothetical protein
VDIEVIKMEPPRRGVVPRISYQTLIVIAT